MCDKCRKRSFLEKKYLTLTKWITKLDNNVTLAKNYDREIDKNQELLKNIHLFNEKLCF